MRGVVFPLALALALVAAPSFAAEPSPSTSEPAPMETRWYGWQTLLVDAASFAVVFGTAFDDKSHGVVPAMGVAGYVLGGPIVHMAHRRWLQAGVSGGLRVTLPLLLGAAAKYAPGGDSCHSSEPDAGDTMFCAGPFWVTIALATVGAVTASLIDAAALTHEMVPAPQPTTKLDIQGARGGGVVVGLTRTF